MCCEAGSVRSPESLQWHDFITRDPTALPVQHATAHQHYVPNKFFAEKITFHEKLTIKGYNRWFQPKLLCLNVTYMSLKRALHLLLNKPVKKSTDKGNRRRIW
jgi:hypothetical protein